MDDLFGDVRQAGRDAGAGAESVDRDDPAEAVRRFRESAARVYGEPMAYSPAPAGGYTPDTIRVQLLDVLADARATPTLTWGPAKIRSYTAQVVLMAEWLKHGEGDRLLAEFKAEMDRLGVPDDQVAPNWARLWGITV